ncbi:endolytic transglycosylase MltG [Motiliproteus sp. SC1-56]|uniref:endolytic transglycosylase MltG n=1 Tax=Motiliproteus sp. SC1-56 TaxID=2799565 RepID=UPI001A8DD105|nr:endolytic transglycosylase MltG [Motiliproteus sp. SC1-56]
MLRRLLLLVPIMLVVAVLALLVGKQKVLDFGERPLALEQEQTYQVRPGSSFGTMVRELEALGVVDQPQLFRLYARLDGNANRIHAGEYRLQPGMTHGELFQNLVAGAVIQRQLTFVEGLRVVDFLVELAAAEGVEQTEGGLTPSRVAELLALDGDNPEGWIYPDTYAYTRGTQDIEILRRAYRRMQEELAEAWDGREKGLPLKSPYEALILASIVEKETAVAEERPAIAGVFVRRLQKGMRLQTDPTVIYGMGEAYNGNITRSDLRRRTPYNTYRIDGLPPTPIASPGRAALDAVLHPAPGDALYFVAKGNGYHQFSASLAEHNRAVRRYQQQARRSDYRSVPTDKNGN